MIAYLKGEIFSKNGDSVVIMAGGIGFEVHMAQSSAASLELGARAELHVSESISPYDGTVLYGFLSAEEKELFLLFRSAVQNTGAKKALEYLNKALKSLPDFKRAVSAADNRLLTGIFGFTGKTAEKLSSALKDKIADLAVQGDGKIRIFPAGQASDSSLPQVLDALAALGYSPSEARKALERLRAEGIKPDAGAEELVKRALRSLS